MRHMDHICPYTALFGGVYISSRLLDHTQTPAYKHTSVSIQTYIVDVFCFDSALVLPETTRDHKGEAELNQMAIRVDCLLAALWPFFLCRLL